MEFVVCLSVCVPVYERNIISNMKEWKRMGLKSFSEIKLLFYLTFWWNVISQYDFLAIAGVFVCHENEKAQMGR